MGRVTIQLSDEAHQALKEAALRRGKTLGEVVEESLEIFLTSAHPLRSRPKAALDILPSKRACYGKLLMHG